MLIIFFSLLFTTSAAQVSCPTRTVNLTADTPFTMLPTLQPPFSSCTYAFNIPTGYYALLTFTATNVTGDENIRLYDQFGDRYYYGVGYCTENCPTISSINTWPSYFELTANTLAGTKMRLQIGVSLKPLDLTTSAGTITVANNTPSSVANNTPSSVVYFKDWKQGTTYTVTSQTKSVYLAADIPSFPEDVWEKYNNVFVFDGGKSVGTLLHAQQYGYFSKSNTLQLYLANTMNYPGAFLVTDYANVKPFEKFEVMFVPVTESKGTASLEGGYKNDQEGCVTIIGEKDGSTPITVNYLSDFGSGASFSYMQGGPLSSHKNLVSPLANSMLPKTISGTVNTFYVSTGTANLHFSVPN